MRPNNEIVLHTEVLSPICPKPVRLFSQAEPQAENTSVQNQMQHNTCDEQDSCAKSVPINTWEESQTSSGNPKIKFVAGYDVYLTQAQLFQANHKSNGNPRKLVIALLAAFSPEIGWQDPVHLEQRVHITRRMTKHPFHCQQ